MKQYKQKITLAITGHRDIIETDELKKELNIYLENLISQNLDKEITLLSPLADGADRFVAKLFLEKKKKYKTLSLVVPMPFGEERYMEDFDKDSKEEFLEFLNKADNVFEVEHLTDSEYLDVGRYVVDNSEILLALWDGTFNGKIGGTGNIVEYAKNRGSEVLHFICIRDNE